MKNNYLDKTIEDYLIKNRDKLKINSNNISKDDVFIALKGKNKHGNKYVNVSLNNGAKYIVTDKKSSSFTNKKNILVVKDILSYLLNIANNKRNSFI